LSSWQGMFTILHLTICFSYAPLRPLALFVASFVVQAGILAAELSDPAAAGDDYGRVIAYATGRIVSIVIYARSREGAALPEPLPMEGIEHTKM